MCERELETEQNCNILTPTLLAITAFLSRYPGLLNGGPGAHSVGCWFSLTHLITNWLNFLCTELYDSSTSTFLWASQIALIQLVHGQGYILIFLDRMHLLFTLVHFLFWQLGRVGGQYTTTRKLMMMHKALHPRNDTTCQEKKVRRRLASIEDTTQRLHTQVRRKIDYNHQKQYRPHNHQQNSNN